MEQPTIFHVFIMAMDDLIFYWNHQHAAITNFGWWKVHPNNN